MATTGTFERLVAETMLTNELWSPSALRVADHPTGKAPKRGATSFTLVARSIAARASGFCWLELWQLEAASAPAHACARERLNLASRSNLPRKRRRFIDLAQHAT